MSERSHTGDLAHRLGIPVWTHAGDVQHVIDETIKHLGRIDVPVNNTKDAWLGHTVNATARGQSLYAAPGRPRMRKL